jgi:hypothetical protein
MNVQHWLDDDQDVPENEYEVITCLACTRLHLINRGVGADLSRARIVLFLGAHTPVDRRQRRARPRWFATTAFRSRSPQGTGLSAN